MSPASHDGGPRTLAEAQRQVRPARAAVLERRELDGLALAFGRARERLQRERQEEPAVRVAAEWVLDNDYLIRRVIGQLRDDLPLGFQRRLPRLVHSGRPRALVVAEAIYDTKNRELDIDVIENFLTAYQEVAALTIAELWALPALLRLAILRHLESVLRAALDGTSATIAAVDAGSAAGRAVRALRLLAEIDWRDVFSSQSATDRVLREDPAGAYAAMDFDTRDQYRHVVEEVALSAGLDEVAVARTALARATEGPPDGRRDHVGYWLIGDGRLAIERSLGASDPTLQRRLRQYPRLAFFGLLLAFQCFALALVVGYLVWVEASLGGFVAALLLCWLPSTVPATAFTHGLLAKLVPPRALPKLDFSDGVPERWRTLVAVPTLLGEPEEVDPLVEQLEVHYLANPDPELRFALLTDHRDSPVPLDEKHDASVARAARAIRRLNARYGRDGRGPFHLLHRASHWNAAEGQWMGWERKRGKLEELNRYLRGDTGTTFAIHEGEAGGLNGVAFVLTLDSDTQLPPGTAARLVGALAHPLNRPSLDAAGRVAAGYTVMQPRVEISPRSARRSAFSRLFSGDTGIDIYTRAVSEVYQDLFAEGIYVGKGIYDVDGLQASLRGRVPENTLVSHDLFEGVQGRAALVTDVVVYEDYPSHYPAYLHRMHRWVRGDWQLVPWLAASVPLAGGGTAKNDLGLVDRFKIVDNLRRSLLPPALLALLVAGWSLLPGHPLFWSLAALFAPGVPAVGLFVHARRTSRRELGRWFLALCFAPEEARVTLDAIARTIVRLAWTRKHLLQWTTAAEADRTLGEHAGARSRRRLWTGPALALVIGGGLMLSSASGLVWAAPWLLCWVVSPAVARRISRPAPSVREELDDISRRTLRHAARRVWLFFETFVGPNDHWLPPDHFQERPRGVVAHRTSPTNIGMLLLSELAAYDLGYLGPMGLSSWVSNTLDTLERLQLHRGHIYNWYDTRTLEPLEPRYVSTVDSGNLAGALIALAVGCERVVTDSPLRPCVRSGLLDTSELLGEAMEQWATASRGGVPPAILDATRALQRLLAAEPTAGIRALLALVDAQVKVIEAELLAVLRSGDSVSHDPTLLRELRVWLGRLAHQLSEARNEAELLLPEVLPDEELTIEAIPRAWEAARAGVANHTARISLQKAADRAGELRMKLRALAERARALASAMDFRFLYDEKRRLFHVGFNVTSDGLDPHHYDLLASEARLASFLAIVRRDVPPRHWFTLGRPLARVRRQGHTLLSWGGSMFEYLMPRMLMRSHEDTLLHQSAAGAVERQIEYGREHATPWGVSESGYALLDGQQAYQYRSFGVPGLGLRRGLEEDLVVAPYASFLALPFRPRAVIANLAELEKLGMLGRYGFYEALDFHPHRAPGGRPAVVHSYMSHHHGMSLIAIDNCLFGDIMVERFHAEPRVQSGVLLLDERVPVEVGTETPHTEGAGTADVALTPPVVLAGWEPDSRSVALWTIGNDALTAFVSADGGGGLCWHDLALTRWEPGPVGDMHGTSIYLRDEQSGETIGATPEPVGGWPAEARVRFEAGSVEFQRRHAELSIRTRITVAASEDVEVRELEISNEGDQPRTIRVFGCMEPVLVPEREFARHPAFSKLFLRCSPVAELSGVLVSRQDRGSGLAPLLLFRVVADSASAPRLVEIDRGSFIGRGGSSRSPVGLSADHTGPAQQTLDPLCVCAADLELPPGTTRSVAFVTAVATTRAALFDLGRRFGSALAIRWAFEDASRGATRRVERLGVSPELLPVAQRLLSALVVPERSLRVPAPGLTVGRPSQRKLWGRGISGDEPIALVRMDSGQSNQLLGELLFVHRYLRALSVRFDVVVVDEAPSGYEAHGTETVRRFLVERGAAGLLHQRGGIHVVPVDQARGSELGDLFAAARVYLDGRRGSLARQLEERSDEPVLLPPFQPAGPPPGAAPDPELSLEVPELQHDNGLGGFDGDEYVVRPGVSPPAPWCNVIANESFGCLVSEGALGSSWCGNAGENRLTPWRNDPVLDPPSEVLYLRDEETGRVWSTTPKPAGVPTLVRHGQGYSVYRSVCAGLEQTMTVFVPPDLPVKVVRFSVRNAAARPRRLTATYFAEWVLGTRQAETRGYILPELLASDTCLLAETSWSMDFAGRVAFLAADRALHGCTTDRVEMLGRSGDRSAPAALGRWGLSGRVEPGLDPCAALQVHVELGSREEAEVCFFLGQADDRQQALEIVRRLRAPGAVEAAWQASCRFWERLLGAVEIRTPDAAFDRLCNRWLLYQSLASRFFGRTAFYQSSGAFGFRDQLQDGLAFLHCDPLLTRRHLLEAAAHQFVEGDVLHWWHPPGGAGVRTRCSDDLLWLVYATAEYVEATGDRDVLFENVPFLVGEPLGPTGEAQYGRFAAAEAASLLEHCRRALSRGFTRGSHGLPLIGDGDWNDGMNRIGHLGRGESVWLGWFVHTCAEKFAALLDCLDEPDEARSIRERLPDLARALAEDGWDGSWYKRAYRDNGTPVGSAHSAPPHIDSIAQSWAVLSGASEPEKAAQGLSAAERLLVHEPERLVLLLAPPFGPHDPDPGYIAAYPPGVRENGGQYTHAAAWLGWAHARLGDGDAAYRIFSLLNPLERTLTQVDVERYRVEPYVLAADVYARPPWVGRGGWTWYTGAAAWTWRLAIEAILGLKRRGGALEVDPCLPRHWNGFEATVRVADLTVRVTVHNNGARGHGVSAARLDGHPIERARLELTGGGERHLEVWLGVASTSEVRVDPAGTV